MKKVIRLNENDIENLVKKILKEENDDIRPRGGMMYGDKADVVDEVINRIGQYGEKYTFELEQLNNRFPSTKYKRISSPTNVVLPKGVKVQSTVHPNR
jgi:hypothetical protein